MPVDSQSWSASALMISLVSISAIDLMSSCMLMVPSANLGRDCGAGAVEGMPSDMISMWSLPFTRT